MTEQLHVPIRIVIGEKWGALAYLIDRSQAVDSILKACLQPPHPRAGYKGDSVPIRND